MFNNNDSDKNAETKTDELWVTPANAVRMFKVRTGHDNLPYEWPRSSGVGAQSIKASSSIAIRAPSPILHTVSDQIHAHK